MKVTFIIVSIIIFSLIPMFIVKNDNVITTGTNITVNDPKQNEATTINVKIIPSKNDKLVLFSQIGVVIATVLLAFIAVFQIKLHRWLLRPKLDILINSTAPDFHMAILKNSKYESNCYYFRIRILNKGKSSAENVEVYADNLRMKDKNGNFVEVKSFLPMNLIWSHIGGMYFRSISPNMPKFCDLCHIVNPKNRELFPDECSEKYGETITMISLDQIVKSHTKSYLIGPGEYELDLIVSAVNAKPEKKKLFIKHTGKWFDNEEQMFIQGITIDFI